MVDAPRIGDYAQVGRPEEVLLLCSFLAMYLCAIELETNVGKFPVLNHAALNLGVQPLRTYLNLACEYEVHTLPNKKVSAAKDRGESYIRVRPPLVRHL